MIKKLRVLSMRAPLFCYIITPMLDGILFEMIRYDAIAIKLMKIIVPKMIIAKSDFFIIRCFKRFVLNDMQI